MRNDSIADDSDAFSKKLKNHIHMPRLYFVHYNFRRIHKAQKVRPAMAAAVTDPLRGLELDGLADRRERAGAGIPGIVQEKISNRGTARHALSKGLEAYYHGERNRS